MSAILQSSFFPSLSILGNIPNLVFILFFIIIFFEGKNDYDLGFWSAIIAGFFLDNLILSYFGVAIVSLLVIYFLEKLTMHFIKEQQSKTLIVFFASLFLISYIVFNFTVYVFSVLIDFQFNFSFDSSTIYLLFYSLVIACFGFYIYKFFIKKYKDEKQLKLL